VSFDTAVKLSELPRLLGVVPPSLVMTSLPDASALPNRTSSTQTVAPGSVTIVSSVARNCADTAIEETTTIRAMTSMCFEKNFICKQCLDSIIGPQAAVHFTQVRPSP